MDNFESPGPNLMLDTILASLTITPSAPAISARYSRETSHRAVVSSTTNKEMDSPNMSPLSIGTNHARKAPATIASPSPGLNQYADPGQSSQPKESGQARLRDDAWKRRFPSVENLKRQLVSQYEITDQIGTASPKMSNGHKNNIVEEEIEDLKERDILPAWDITDIAQHQTNTLVDQKGNEVLSCQTPRASLDQDVHSLREQNRRLLSQNEQLLESLRKSQNESLNPWFLDQRGSGQSLLQPNDSKQPEDSFSQTTTYVAEMARKIIMLEEKLEAAKQAIEQLERCLDVSGSISSQLPQNLSRSGTRDSRRQSMMNAQSNTAGGSFFAETNSLLKFLEDTNQNPEMSVSPQDDISGIINANNHELSAIYQTNGSTPDLDETSNSLVDFFKALDKESPAVNEKLPTDGKKPNLVPVYDSRNSTNLLEWECRQLRELLGRYIESEAKWKHIAQSTTSPEHNAGIILYEDTLQLLDLAKSECSTLRRINLRLVSAYKQKASIEQPSQITTKSVDHLPIDAAAPSSVLNTPAAIPTSSVSQPHSGLRSVSKNALASKLRLASRERRIATTMVKNQKEQGVEVHRGPELIPVLISPEIKITTPKTHIAELSPQTIHSEMQYHPVSAGPGTVSSRKNRRIYLSPITPASHSDTKQIL